MIFNKEPTDWKDLQQKVCQAFLEIGCMAEIEKDINTVRGTVNIDVYVVDMRTRPELTYICECKYWNTPVPQTIIHSFLTVINNLGANIGYIISKNGFQKGAYDAASNTNIVLLSWNQFQEMLFDQWRKAMFTKVEAIAGIFSEYFDFYSGPPRDSDDNNELSRLFEKYSIYLTASPYLNFVNTNKVLEFPINTIDPREDLHDIGKISIDNYRDYFDILIEASETGIQAFKDFRDFLRKKHGSD